MPDLQTLVKQYIRDTSLAHEETRGDVRGVVFHDEGEFIPYRDLGYNTTYGFYRLSHLPNVENEAPYATWTIHPVAERFPDPDHPWQPFALLDSGGFGFLLGERWQAAELLPVLQAFLERGESAEPIYDDDEAFGYRWLTISEAVQVAHEFDAEKYPLDGKADYRIRQAARRGNWLENGSARQTDSGRWQFRADRFERWLDINRGRTNDRADIFTPEEIGEMIAERDEALLAAAEDEDES